MNWKLGLFERLLLWSRDKLGGADWIASAQGQDDAGRGNTYRCQSKVTRNRFCLSSVKYFHGAVPQTAHEIVPEWCYLSQWVARKHWAAAPSTQSSTVESSIVHVVDYCLLPPLNVVCGWPAGLRWWCCHAKSERKMRVTSHPLRNCLRRNQIKEVKGMKSSLEPCGWTDDVVVHGLHPLIA